ncbi:LysR family transcriptional regulator [Pseudomonas songnenensis]|jgi:DNA-binding transcriptional LysR family regulator|uniref:LysR family transcriptional regulator n=1 Tax=Pseudomonas songnenensis TaxID=1176259 RepID=A0A482UJ22_9PSED|nr:LysR family transcriptional regulator [Pseudomonas songnenensis]AWM60545.1 LysR family transcriptional regulator [Stutzerimonas stutzeri]MCQ4301120.1 LysR substrate-binding domain-containing protein [Pseudomonas songnenensis]RMH99746.1 LysR family transcriptional regulator [Pseudomonas songnenensis]RYJ63812.1 LysR family transcriptional regulator [Pseudomonas songnenensis]
MDIDLARTFLEIIRSGSFIATAERLHITQTAVTARIQNLESQLSCKLFVRNRAGARLTADGERFASYARQLVQTWEAARRDLPLPRGYGELLTLGAEVSLCNPLMLAWMQRLRQALPSHALRSEVASDTELQHKLELGALDAALVHQPEYRPGLQVEQLLEEKLILVAHKHQPAPYLYIDWGPAFRKQHDQALPEHTRAALTFSLGPLALQYLLQCGGRGYFRTRVVQRYLDEGLLERVAHAPEFSYPVYLVHARASESPALLRAVEALRDVARDEYDWSRWYYPH